MWNMVEQHPTRLYVTFLDKVEEYAFAVAYSVVSSLVLFYLFYPKKAEHFVYIWTSFTS